MITIVYVVSLKSFQIQTIPIHTDTLKRTFVRCMCIYINIAFNMMYESRTYDVIALYLRQHTCNLFKKGQQQSVECSIHGIFLCNPITRVNGRREKKLVLELNWTRVYRMYIVTFVHGQHADDVVVCSQEHVSGVRFSV